MSTAARRNVLATIAAVTVASVGLMASSAGASNPKAVTITVKITASQWAAVQSLLHNDSTANDAHATADLFLFMCPTFTAGQPPIPRLISQGSHSVTFSVHLSARQVASGTKAIRTGHCGNIHTVQQDYKSAYAQWAVANKPFLKPRSSSTVPATTAPTGPMTTFGDGTWAVGTVPGKVAPGTYYTTGTGVCYWERDSDLTGSPNSTLANANIAGPAIVTILPTDAGFKSQSCGTWSPLPPTGSQATSFGDGVYAVGITIAPGTYSAPGGGSCYWEQDSDFTFGGNATLSNDNPSGPVTLTIAAPTEAFKTQGCGTWHQ